MRAREVFRPDLDEEQLQELQGIKKTPTKFDSFEDFLYFMQDGQFQMLGYGLSGAVFTHKAFNGRYVLKVFQDAFYEDFIRIAQAHATNPHFPKFMGRVIPVSKTVKMVRIETLSDMRQDQFEKLLGGTFGFIDLKEAARKIALRSLSRKDPSLSRWDEAGLGQFLDALAIVYANTPDGSRDDLHSENVMMRKAVPVITDPWQGAKVYPFKW
jgi:hypothetical protein